MRKVIVKADISLDSVIENGPSYIFDYIDKELEADQDDLLNGADALLLGRITYEGFVKYWPQHGDDRFGARMNSLPKYVASRSLQAPLDWNATLMKDPVEAVRALKQQPGKNLLQYGIGDLSLTLIRAGLVDEIRLLIYPIVIGKGARVLENLDKTTLKLVDSHTFNTGVLGVTYQPQPAS